MITIALIKKFVSVNMRTTDPSSLDDIRKLEFDSSIPVEERSAYVLKKLKNPLCFRCGEVGIKLEFEDAAPPVEELLTHFLIRKKSEL